MSLIHYIVGLLVLFALFIFLTIVAFFVSISLLVNLITNYQDIIDIGRETLEEIKNK